MIEKHKFQDYGEQSQDRGKVLTLRLNEAEYEKLKWAMKALSQPKEGTALKQLVDIGLLVLQQDLTGRVVGMIFKNKQKNWRTGVVDPDKYF